MNEQKSPSGENRRVFDCVEEYQISDYCSAAWYIVGAAIGRPPTNCEAIC